MKEVGLDYRFPVLQSCTTKSGTESLKKSRSVKYLETYVMYVVLGVMLPVEHCTGSCDARGSEAASLHKFCAKIIFKNVLDPRLQNMQSRIPYQDFWSSQAQEH